MAKRRLLKKDISYVAGDLLTEVWILGNLVPGIEQAKTEGLMSRIINMHDEFIRRAHQPAGKDNKKHVKEYYNKLVADLQKEVEDISEEMQTLSKAKEA